MQKSIDQHRERDRGQGIYRSEDEILQEIVGKAEEVPALWPELWPVLGATARMGTDANGTLLHAERVSWLDENGIDDPGERETLHRFFDAIDGARAEARQELHDEMTRQR